MLSSQCWTGLRRWLEMSLYKYSFIFFKENVKVLKQKLVARERFYSKPPKNSSGEMLWCVEMSCPRKAVLGLRLS